MYLFSAPESCERIPFMVSSSNAALDLSHGDHFLPQEVLVRADRAVPFADGLVLADHDVLGDFVEESFGTGSVGDCGIEGWGVCIT